MTDLAARHDGEAPFDGDIRLGENLLDNGCWLFRRCWDKTQIDDAWRWCDSLAEYQFAVVAVKRKDEAVLSNRSLNHGGIKRGGIDLRDRNDIVACCTQEFDAWQWEVLVREQTH